MCRQRRYQQQTHQGRGYQPTEYNNRHRTFDFMAGLMQLQRHGQESERGQQGGEQYRRQALLRAPQASSGMWCSLSGIGARRLLTCTTNPPATCGILW